VGAKAEAETRSRRRAVTERIMVVLAGRSQLDVYLTQQAATASVRHISVGRKVHES